MQPFQTLQTGQKRYAGLHPASCDKPDKGHRTKKEVTRSTPGRRSRGDNGPAGRRRTVPLATKILAQNNAALESTLFQASPRSGRRQARHPEVIRAELLHQRRRWIELGAPWVADKVNADQLAQNFQQRAWEIAGQNPEDAPPTGRSGQPVLWGQTA